MSRLAEDHLNARRFGERLIASRQIVLDLATVQTNIIVFDVANDAPEAPGIVARAREHGVLLYAFGPRTLRAVTHLDVSREQCERAAELVVGLAEASIR
jgi:threonine aldolase